MTELADHELIMSLLQQAFPQEAIVCKLCDLISGQTTAVA